MDERLEGILSVSNTNLSTEEIIYLRELFSKMTDEEVCRVITKYNRYDLIEIFIDDYDSIIKCYVHIGLKLNKSFDDKIYETLVYAQDDELILRYLEYISFDYLRENLISLVKDDYLKLQFVLGEGSFRKIDVSGEKFLVACSIKNDDYLSRCLDCFHDQNQKVELIKRIKSDETKAKLINRVQERFYYSICETISSQDILKKIYKNHINSPFSDRILWLIDDDELKLEVLNNYNMVQRIGIIKSLNSEESIQQVLLNSEYDDYCSNFLERVNNWEFITNYFNKKEDLIFKLKVILSINNFELKKKLILDLSDQHYQKVLLANIESEKDSLLELENGIDMVYDIDPRITIGVELEACSVDAKIYLMIKQILGNWNIKKDSSVEKGLEITSPILRYDYESLRELEFVCQMLKDDKFYTDESCGGHIHLGFDYFDSALEFRTFLTLYKSLEDVIYLVSNRTNTVIREKCTYYAKKISPLLNRIIKVNLRFNEITDISEYIKMINVYTENSRYYGLNLFNALSKDKNTVEFRMPNGEIEFEELLLNIRLFVKMMEFSKKIADLLNKDKLSDNDKEILNKYKMIIGGNCTNEEKLMIFLELNFREEEIIKYYERYKTNKKLNKKQQGNNPKVLERGFYIGGINNG